MLLGVNHDIKEGEFDPAIIALLLCLLPRKDWGDRGPQYLTPIVLFIIFFLYSVYGTTGSTAAPCNSSLGSRHLV